MSKKSKTILTVLVTSIIIIAIGLFGVYKYFVTPDKMLMLSVVNMRSDFEDSFDYITDDEKELIEKLAQNGGKLELKSEIEKLSYLENVPFKMTINSDKRCSVTSINIYDKFNIDVYKDESRMLINTPLFSGGGFSIPVSDFKHAWNSSIFKDIWTVSQEYTLNDILLDFAKGNLDIKDFYSDKSNEIMTLIKRLEVKKDGTSKVMIGGKAKNAKRYKVHISKNITDEFIGCFTEYFAGTDYGKEKIKSFSSLFNISEEEGMSKIFQNIFSSNDDFDVTFKIHDGRVREIFTETSDGKTYTLSFSGEDNMFDTISYYKNNEVENAVKRVKTKSHDNASDTVSAAGKNILSLDTTDDGFDLKFDGDYALIEVHAAGKTENDNSISFDDVSMHLNGIKLLNGSCYITEDYDKDFSFNKSGEYVNLLEISQQEWEYISGSMLNGISFITGESSVKSF